MLSINMDDVMNVLNIIKAHLIVFGVIVVLAIAVMVACKKLPQDKKFLFRAQSGLAVFLAVAVIANIRI